MKFKNILKKSLLVLAVLLIIMQFFKPAKNESGIKVNSIASIYTVPEPIDAILTTACNDCHSNKTVYPWYANIQPVAWWLNDHVEEGKRKLNFDEFAKYPYYRQYHKLEEVIEEVEESEMPLSSYTIIHGNAKLSDEQKTALVDWAKGIRLKMETTLPSDSLINPKKRKHS